MRSRMLLLLGLAVCVVVGTAPVSARLLESWPYEKLFAKSDLVVIATPRKTVASEDKEQHDNWGREFAGQNTTFVVNHALKGKAKEKEIKVLHFKFGALKKDVKPDSLEAMLIVDGPRFVTFRTTSVFVTDGEGTTFLPAPEYMLFLKRMKDGRYEPVSGRIDPVDSVRELGKVTDRVLKTTK